MNKVFAGMATLFAALSLGAAPAFANHYGGYGKSGYGMDTGAGHYGKSKSPGYGYRSHRYAKPYGKGYRKGHCGYHRGGHHGHNKRMWSKGHSGYKTPYAQGYGQAGAGDDYGYGKPQGVTSNSYSSPQTMAPTATSAPAIQPTTAAPPASPRNIVETAVAGEQFATLVSAVKAADLVETLSGKGPFTVFAPTNAAFDKLPEGTVPGLLGNTDALTKVLTYHVIAGRVKAADLVEKGEFETLNGATVRLDQLQIAKADVDTANGVIHIIDEVLLPPGS
jgi:uncharacterized surface protein with fasciclin (FAS1) repeats